ncbi:MAG: TolB family protein [Bacillota bacterium]
MHRSNAGTNANRVVRERTALRAICLVLAAVILVGCSRTVVPPEEPKTVTVVDPVELTRTEISGQWLTVDQSRCISPDGKHLLAVVLGESTETMSAIPMPETDGGPGQDLGDSVALYSIDTSWTKHNLVQWIPVGWLSDAKCVYIIHGWQNGGEHHGQRGSAVMVGDITTETSSLVAFMEASEPREIVDEAVLTEHGTLVFRVLEKVWSVDIQSNTKRLIRKDFPNYGSLFYFALSPRGDYAVYSLNEHDRTGIFIMDLATGTERPLLAAGDTYSFYPVWSPDGRYIMAYTASSSPDASGQGLQLYRMLPGEDGPFAAAEAITVADVHGEVVRTIALGKDGQDGQDGEQGESQSSEATQFLFTSAWLADSEHVVFVSGPVTLGKWGEVRSKDYTGVWICDVTTDSEPVKCADLLAVRDEIGETINYIYPVASLPDGRSALLNLGGTEAGCVWRVGEDGSNSKVLDGWWTTPRVQPYFLDRVVGIVRLEEEARCWLVGPSEAMPLDEITGDDVSIVAYNDGVLVTMSHGFQTNDSAVYIHSMLKEMIQE